MNKDTLTVIEADRMLYLAYKDVISLLGLDTFTRLVHEASFESSLLTSPK